MSRDPGLIGGMDEKMCSKCGEAPAGSGGILCPDCMEKISARRLES